MGKMMKPKVVIVTGASAGLGRAIAIKFAQKNLSVGLISRNAERLESLKQELEGLGVRAAFAICDVAEADQVEKAASSLENELGPIDIWVNNAMTSIFSPFKEITPEEYKRVTEVSYLGCVYGTMSALKSMLPRNKGIIIQVGSALAYRAIPLQSAYCGAKHAIEGFTESIRCELLHDNSNVRITMVQMPAMNTPQFNWVKSRLRHKPQPVPPIFQPEVGAQAVVWSAFHYRREWIVGGSSAMAIIGNKFFPGLGDRYLGKTGYDAQQYNGLDDPNRPNNLFETVSGPFGSHGDFDGRAREFSFQFWFTRYRILILILILLLIFLTGFYFLKV